MASNSSSSGIGVLGLLGVMFVTLKLLGVIKWSWWWVTIPFWGLFAFVLIGLLIWLIYMIIKEANKKNPKVIQKRKN